MLPTRTCSTLRTTRASRISTSSFAPPPPMPKKDLGACLGGSATSVSEAVEKRACVTSASGACIRCLAWPKGLGCLEVAKGLRRLEESGGDGGS
eukprot:1749502-Rhodomonas_salina.2